MITIYFSLDDELSEFEAINKGYRNDVYAVIDKKIFQLNIYTPIRLIQDFEIEIRYYGFYPVDNNLVLVTNTDKKTIISTVLNLYANHYFNDFNDIKSVTEKQIDSFIKVY
ncbi:MAG: hypothetical protein HDT22_11570 [Ruminococcus sp.]|nr:hypothetical protein [Ruminococcus sp.]